MDDRLLLEHIDYTAHTVTIDGQVYPLNDAHFPTVDPADPYRLSDGEASLMASLVGAFRRSPALRRHIEFLYTCGSLYRVCNGNLLFHGCIPLCADGSFDTVRTFDGQSLAGRAYMDFCDRTARAAFYDGGQNELDFMYYLWCGRQSPLFGRSRMTTFERYFVSDCSASTAVSAAPTTTGPALPATRSSTPRADCGWCRIPPLAGRMPPSGKTAIFSPPRTLCLK